MSEQTTEERLAQANKHLDQLEISVALGYRLRDAHIARLENALAEVNARAEAVDVNAIRRVLKDVSYFGHLSASLLNQDIASAVDRVLAGEDINVREVVEAGRPPSERVNAIRRVVEALAAGLEALGRLHAIGDNHGRPCVACLAGESMQRVLADPAIRPYLEDKA